MEKFKEEKRNRNQKIKRFTIGSLFLVLAVLVVVKIAVTNGKVNSGNEITKLKEEIQITEEENSILEDQITLETSLPKLKERAVLLGFKENDTFFYVLPNPYAARF